MRCCQRGTQNRWSQCRQRRTACFTTTPSGFVIICELSVSAVHRIAQPPLHKLAVRQFDVQRRVRAM
jgi:hypothetical protein